MSDAMTDINRDSRIAEARDLLVRQEQLFLLWPTRERIKEIIKYAENLDGKPRGYNSPTTRGVLSSYENYYAKEFPKGKNLIISDNHLVRKINGIHWDERINYLADTMTLGAKKDWEEFTNFYLPIFNSKLGSDIWDKRGKEYFNRLFYEYNSLFVKNKNLLKNSFTLAHGEILINNKPVSAKELDRILVESGVKEVFPVKYVLQAESL